MITYYKCWLDFGFEKNHGVWVWNFFLKMKRPFGSKFKVGLILDTYLKNSRAEFKASSGPILQLPPIAFTTLICLLRHKAWLKLLWTKNMCILQLVYFSPTIRNLA